VVGIKEASSDITKITKLCRTCSDFSVWTGNDELIVPSISLGAKGVISVLSNLLPIQTNAMAQAVLDGDLDTAAAMQQELQPLVDLLFCEPNPIPIKAAMRYIGYDCGSLRLPLTELSKDNMERLKKALAR
jgi:4-hydroxy-tetrahydrodipicolinate synthase